MIPLGPSHCFCLYREPADMRKSFDGLCGLVRSGLNRDPGWSSWAVCATGDSVNALGMGCLVIHSRGNPCLPKESPCVHSKKYFA